MNVKLLREQHGLTQQELAAATGIPKDRIGKWEQGKGKPKTEDYKTLEKFFNEHVPRELPKKTADNHQNNSGDAIAQFTQVLLELMQTQNRILQDQKVDLVDRVKGIEVSLNTALGGVHQLSLHVESARAVVLESLNRIEKKKPGELAREADRIVEQLMKEKQRLGKSSLAGM